MADFTRSNKAPDTSGISPPFGGLFQTYGKYLRVTHPFAMVASGDRGLNADFTQTNAEYFCDSPRPVRARPRLLKKATIRLACIRHAASVHPEPGSNSHKE